LEPDRCEHDDHADNAPEDTFQEALTGRRHDPATHKLHELIITSAFLRHFQAPLVFPVSLRIAGGILLKCGLDEFGNPIGKFI